MGDDPEFKVSTGMGKFLLTSNQVPILRNFLVVKLHGKSNLVPQMRNLSPTLDRLEERTANALRGLIPYSLFESERAGIL